MRPVHPEPDRLVVVTGAGSGLGLATVSELARMGFAAVGVVPDEREEDALCKLAREEDLSIGTRRADLTDPAQRSSLVAELSPWALVNNAGYMNAGGVRDVSIDEGRAQLEAMVIAPLDLALQALPAMLRRGDGRIVNVTSAAAHAATPLTGWYQATKAALRELNDSLRLELRDTAIKVIDLEPGGYRTGIWPRAARELRRHGRGSARQNLYNRIARRLPAVEPFMGDPVQVARTVGRLLTTARPPAHCRVGPGATSLRLVTELFPDRLWDRLIAAGTHRHGN